MPDPWTSKKLGQCGAIAQLLQPVEARLASLRDISLVTSSVEVPLRVPLKSITPSHFHVLLSFRLGHRYSK